MAGRFDGRLVLVTGGAAGLGRAIALRFAGEGADVALLDIDDAGLAAVKREVEALGRACATYRVDVSSEPEIEAFGAAFSREHPSLDVLVNNAGLAYGEVSSEFESLSQAKWLRFLSINTVAPLLLAKALRAPLAATGRGVITNQSSMASYMPGTAYGVTKSALNAMTYGMASLFAADGVRVNAVLPGIMETPASAASLSSDTVARVQGAQMLRLHGTAEDIAALHAFLASDDARFITAELMSCDAGNRFRGWRS